jgi:hypothetical protein
MRSLAPRPASTGNHAPQEQRRKGSHRDSRGKCTQWDQDLPKQEERRTEREGLEGRRKGQRRAARTREKNGGRRGRGRKLQMGEKQRRGEGGSGCPRTRLCPYVASHSYFGGVIS